MRIRDRALGLMASGAETSRLKGSSPTTHRVGAVRKVRGRRAVAAALACLSAVGITACGTTPLGSGSGSKSAAIGFSGAKLIDPFQVVLVHNVNAEAKALGLKVLPATNANADPAKQVTDTTTLLSQGIGGLILIPVDSSAVVPAVDGYQDALVSQPLDLYAKYTAQYIKDARAGKTYRPGPTDHGSKIVEFKGNLMDELPSPLVTKENVDEPALWGNKA